MSVVCLLVLGACCAAWIPSWCVLCVCDSVRFSYRERAALDEPGALTNSAICMLEEPTAALVHNISEEELPLLPSPNPFEANPFEANLFEAEPFEAEPFEHLKTHLLVHSSAKPFPCPHCLFASKRKWGVTHHIKSMHRLPCSARAVNGALDEPRSRVER